MTLPTELTCMAEEIAPYDGLPSPEDYDDYSEFMEAEREAMDKLREHDTLVRFHRADGYAIYRVVQEDPLTLQHVPFGDGYRIPAAHMRGLLLEDIENQL